MRIYQIIPFTILLLFVCLFQIISAQSDERKISLTAEEKLWIEKHGNHIRLAPDPKFAPYEFLNSQGTFEGIVLDYFKLLEKKTGLNFTIIRKDNWSAILESAKDKEVDVLGLTAETEKRNEFLSFTHSLVSTRAVIITRQTVDKELSISDLEGMHICMIKDYNWESIIHRDYPGLSIDHVTDPLVGMRKVSYGICDAIILGLAQASYYIEKEGFANLKIAGETEYSEEFAIAVRNDWPELVSILNKGIQQISRKEEGEIQSRWYYHDYKGVYFSKRIQLIILACICFVVIFLAVMFVFNKRLKSLVKEKTKALQNEQNHLQEVNKMLLVAHDKAKESERLTKAFLTNISHEIRTPMNSIIGFAQLIEVDEACSNDHQRYAALMIKGGQQLLSILDRIIQLSKMESGVIKPMNEVFDIYNLIWETHELMLPLTLDANLSFKLQINDQAASKKIVSDRLLLQQVLNNLLSNAIRFTPEGEVVLVAECNKNTLKISIYDTGIGIDKEDREAVFEPFRQIKHRTNIASGAGLGLATTKKIIEVLNGTIWIESNDPKGSVFHVTIPVSEDLNT